MSRLSILGVLLLFGVAVAQETTTFVPDLAEQVELEEPNSIENTLQSESSADLIEIIERLSLDVSNTGELKRFRSSYWEDWVPPYNISKKFPYYLAGYDDENRPIWVLEYGKWDIRSLIVGGNDTTSAFEKCVYQAIYRVYRSFVERSTPGRPVTEFNLIIDFDGYSLVQATHVQTVVYLMGLFRRFHDILYRHLSLACCINVNFLAERFVNTVKPLLGAISERVDVYGTRRDKWMHALSRHFPNNQLPEWYGGDRNFVPVKVYG